MLSLLSAASGLVVPNIAIEVRQVQAPLVSQSRAFVGPSVFPQSSLFVADALDDFAAEEAVRDAALNARVSAHPETTTHFMNVDPFSSAQMLSATVSQRAAIKKAQAEQEAKEQAELEAKLAKAEEAQRKFEEKMAAKKVKDEAKAAELAAVREGRLMLLPSLSTSDLTLIHI